MMFAAPPPPLPLLASNSSSNDDGDSDVSVTFVDTNNVVSDDWSPVVPFFSTPQHASMPIRAFSPALLPPSPPPRSFSAFFPACHSLFRPLPVGAPPKNPAAGPIGAATRQLPSKLPAFLCVLPSVPPPLILLPSDFPRSRAIRLPVLDGVPPVVVRAFAHRSRGRQSEGRLPLLHKRSDTLRHFRHWHPKRLHVRGDLAPLASFDTLALHFAVFLPLA